MYIFAFLLIYKFIKGTFEYEKVSRLELIIIPLYSAIMMLLSLKKTQSMTALGITSILLMVGVAIGFLQASKTQVKDAKKIDAHQRPIIEVKRNWPYLVGWLVSFAIGISVEVFYGAHINAEEVSNELVSEILRDLSVVAFFRGSNAWFVWVLNVATSFTYGTCLMIRYPKIREAIRRRR